MPTYVDNTILGVMAKCDTAAALRHVWGYTSREERATLVSGSACHEAMASYFRDGDKQSALDTFLHGELCQQCEGFEGVNCSRCQGSKRQTAGYKLWCEENVPDLTDRLRHENLTAILSSWIDKHPFSALPFSPRPEWVEIGFAYPLTEDGEFVFCGRMDAIVVDDSPGNPLRILDHKFTGRVDTTFARQFRMDSQFSGYIWAAQQSMAAPVLGGYVNAIETSRLPSDATRKCKEHGVPYAECSPEHLRAQILYVDRTPAQIAAWKSNAIRLARRYRELCERYPEPMYVKAVPQQGQFIWRACVYCEAHDFCAAGRPVEHIDSIFVENRWKPYEHAFPQEAKISS